MPVYLSGRRHGVLLPDSAQLRHDPMVARRRMVAAGPLVGRDRGRFRFVERDTGLRVQSRSLPVSEPRLPVALSGAGRSAGASSLRSPPFETKQKKQPKEGENEEKETKGEKRKYFLETNRNRIERSRLSRESPRGGGTMFPSVFPVTSMIVNNI